MRRRPCLTHMSASPAAEEHDPEKISGTNCDDRATSAWLLCLLRHTVAWLRGSMRGQGRLQGGTLPRRRRPVMRATLARRIHWHTLGAAAQKPGLCIVQWQVTDIEGHKHRARRNQAVSLCAGTYKVAFCSTPSVRCCTNNINAIAESDDSHTLTRVADCKSASYDNAHRVFLSSHASSTVLGCAYRSTASHRR